VKRSFSIRVAPKCGLVVLGTLMSSCAATTEIGPLDPRPELGPSPELLPARLVMGDAVKDSFDVPTRGRAPEVRVREWRATLERGFRVAMAPGGGGTGSSVRLARVELILVEERLHDEEHHTGIGLLAYTGDDEQLPVLLAHGVHTSPSTPAPRAPSHCYAQIVYTAEIVDEAGRVTQRATGSVFSTGSTSRTVSPADVVRSAVERMVEEVVAHFGDRRPG
jgi:hypothetical protein